jgi:hypothetical protein
MSLGYLGVTVDSLVPQIFEPAAMVNLANTATYRHLIVAETQDLRRGSRLAKPGRHDA